MRDWFLIFVYTVPIIGAAVTMARRARALYSFGESFRRLFPDDRFYRKTREWQGLLTGWFQRHSLARYVNVPNLNLLAGKLEYALGHMRDYTIGLYMLGCAVYETTLMVFGYETLYGVRFTVVFYHSVFAILSIFTYRRHVVTGLQMGEFLRNNPEVHPQEFFDHYYRRLGPETVPVPKKATQVVDPHDVSFLTTPPRQGAARQGIRFLLRGLYDTAIFARTAYRAMDMIGYEYGRELFDRMAQLWGKRILQLFNCRLIVKGDEKLKELPGKVVLIFNHKSHLDFVINFFAFSATALKGADGKWRGVRPRYMAARDHFVDNRFVYDGLGIGRLIESVDMVFVDRKGRGKNAVLQACDTLIGHEVEIAMYPQGTRAYGNWGPKRERRDAGYYTTGSLSSLRRPLGHLKKGAAFLAVDTAIRLAPQGRPLHLVPVGIEGTGSIVPKGSFTVQTEVTTAFNVGEAITISPDEVVGLQKPMGELPQTEGERRYNELIDRLMVAIDEGLVKALALHEKLESRFLEDLKTRQLAPMDRFFVIKKNLQKVSFIILDRIYALDPNEWSPYLAELANKLSREAPDSVLEELCGRVTERLVRSRERGSKPMVIQEKKRAAG